MPRNTNTNRRIQVKHTAQELIAARENYGSVRAAAEALGMSKSTYHDQLKLARKQASDIEVPESILTDGLDTDNIYEIREACRNARWDRKAEHDAKTWFEVKVNQDRPYGVIAFGDPHMGDPGSNFPLLEQHVEIANRPNVYGINIGDSTNNWVGGLVRKYADQEISTQNERRLIKWLMTEAGITWLCWLLGNHDTWNEGEAIHRLIGGDTTPIIDWNAQFKLVHPNGTVCKIDASHGRKGNSQWNELHGTLKDAKMSEPADVFITGHTHNYACEDIEIAKTGLDTWLLQVSGYKVFDTYSQRWGFSAYHRGSAAMMIVDPRENARRRMPLVHEDVEMAYDYLQWMRSRA